MLKKPAVPKPNIHANCNLCNYKSTYSFSTLTAITEAGEHSDKEHNGVIDCTLYNPGPLTYKSRTIGK